MSDSVIRDTLFDTDQWISSYPHTRTVAIVGSVDLSPVQLDDATYLVEMILKMEKSDRHLSDVVRVVSGGAAGIDTIGEEKAIELGFSVRAHLPIKPTWYWYKKRNILVAEECDVLYRIAKTNSKTYGSGWTADYAESLGKKVRRYYV